MPLGLAMHGKWDGINMASPTMHSFKHERPAYSTPQPVDNTPSNNECRLVELRGAKVASFIIGGDEFICLPQAFDLFLKHMVGGLHTVYTKLKRLNISPVVCNVEQVRVLRGLGAIQPGVNRCKLITRKDFEILYQDCTQASRPGRPPKRYPMLPPTTDLTTHYPGMRSMAHGMMGATDLSALHKRIRLDQEAEKNLLQQQERRLSDSPQRDVSALSTKDLSISGTNDLQANAANLYLQAQQALRRQYQQVVTSGIHNGLDSQQVVAGVNPALAPLMMMSHPALFSGAFPPGMLNHINQFAQNQGNNSAVSNAAVAAAAQIAANGGNMQQQAAAYQIAAAAQSAAQVSLSAAVASAKGSPRQSEIRSSPAQGDKIPDAGETETSKSLPVTIRTGDTTNGEEIGGHGSPNSSISSLHGEDNSVGGASLHSDSGDSLKLVTDDPAEQQNNRQILDQKDDPCSNDVEELTEQEEGAGNQENPFVTVAPLTGPGNISSMQTLLTNIQGLLKVAADNARVQEKHTDLKNQMALERQMRGSAEKKLEASERNRDIIQKRLKRERKVRKVLQEQLETMKQHTDQENSNPTLDKIATAPSVPITGVLGSGREIPTRRSPSVSPKQQRSPNSLSRNRENARSPNCFSENIATNDQFNSQTQVSTASSFLMSSASSGSGEPPSFSSPLTVSTCNTNNNNNKSVLIHGDNAHVMPTSVHYTNDRKTSADFDSDTNAQVQREFTESLSAASHLFFNAGHYQTAATQ